MKRLRRVRAKFAWASGVNQKSLAMPCGYARQRANVDAERNPAMAQIFIINPLAGEGANNLFSTHPNTQTASRT